MSIKRRFENKYRSLLATLKGISLPNWMFSLSFRVCLSVFIVLAGVGYLDRISTLATSGYQLHDLETQIDDLTVDIQKNQVVIASFSSIASIEKRLENTNMVAVSVIGHINLGDSLVAKR